MKMLLWRAALSAVALCACSTCRADGWLASLRAMKSDHYLNQNVVMPFRALKSDRYLYQNVVVPFRNSEVNRYLYENVTKNLQVEIAIGEAAINYRSAHVALIHVTISRKKED